MVSFLSNWRDQKKRRLSNPVQTKLKGISKSLLASTLGISRRNLYNQNRKQDSKDELLKHQIIKVMELNPAYGHRRIAIELGIGKKRARRAMKLFNLKPYKRKARWIKKKDWGQPDAGYPMSDGPAGAVIAIFGVLIIAITRYDVRRR